MRMKRLIAVLSAPVFLFSLVANGEDNPRLTFKGLGDIRIGMSEAQLEKMGFSDPYRTDDWQTDEEYWACHYLASDAYPDITFMINEGTLVRIGIYKDYKMDRAIPWRSLSGVNIGMSETEVAAIYGDWLKMDYHPYMDNAGSYLILNSSDGRYKMIFETALDDSGNEKLASDPRKGANPAKKVTSMRAGFSGPVDYIEGCA